MPAGSLSSGGRHPGRLETTDNVLTSAQAAGFARLALANVEREFPNKLDHVMAGAADIAAPRTLHPAFFGSFDWHSCVHAHWLLARILRLQADIAEAALIRRTLDSHLSAANVAAEVEYFRRPESRAFERSYGWAWLLKLAAELERWSDVDAQRWSRNLAPLAQAVAGAYLDWLPDATYPIRHGVHSNTAFALAFAHDYAGGSAAIALGELAAAKAREWYLADSKAPARWEPSGADFFSPALIEADLMRRILDVSEFPDWLARFLPGIERREPRTLFSPAVVSNRSDPYIVHLDGLNLSRAWCWRAIGCALPRDDPRATIATAAADAHRAAGMAGVTSGEYVGDHWLATFAVLALTT